MYLHCTILRIRFDSVGLLSALDIHVPWQVHVHVYEHFAVTEGLILVTPECFIISHVLFL